MNFNFKMFSPLKTPINFKQKAKERKKLTPGSDSDVSVVTKDIRKEVDSVLKKAAAKSDSDTDCSTFKLLSLEKRQNKSGKQNHSMSDSFGSGDDEVDGTPRGKAAKNPSSAKTRRRDTSESDEDSDMDLFSPRKKLKMSQGNGKSESIGSQGGGSPSKKSSSQTTESKGGKQTSNSGSSGSDSSFDSDVNDKNAPSPSKKTKNSPVKKGGNQRERSSSLSSNSSDSENDSNSKDAIVKSPIKDKKSDMHDSKSTSPSKKNNFKKSNDEHSVSGESSNSGTDSDSDDGADKTAFKQSLEASQASSAVSRSLNSPRSDDSSDAESDVGINLSTLTQVKTSSKQPASKRKQEATSEEDDVSNTPSSENSRTVSPIIPYVGNRKDSESDVGDSEMNQTTNIVIRGRNKQSFKPPKHFEEVEPSVTNFLKDNLMKGKQLFLIRAPANFQFENFEKHKLKLDGSSTITDKNSNTEFSIDVHRNLPQELKCLRSVQLDRVEGEQVLSFAHKLTGQIYIKNKGPRLEQVKIHRHSPVKHVVKDCHRPPLVPFGCKSPEHVPFEEDNLKQSKKKKKKVKREKEEMEVDKPVMNSFEETNMSVDVCDGEVREPKHADSMNFSNTTDEPKNEKQKKKKKRKSIDENVSDSLTQEIKDIDTTDVLDTTEDNTQVKKKKKKKHKSSDERISDIGETERTDKETMDESNNTEESERKDKKKKKKRKESGVFSDTSANCDVGDTNTCDLSVEKKKKKKKKKEKDREDEVNLTLEASMDVAVEKKKKKKKDKSN